MTNSSRPRRSGGSRNSNSRGGSASGSNSSRRRGGFSRDRRGGGSRSGGRGSGRSGSGRGGGSRGGSRGGGRVMPTFDPSKFINANPVEVKEEVYEPQHTFATFGFDGRIVRNTQRLNLTVPTPIQDQSIPEILEGRDIIGLAETGTGKTAAFLLPLIHKTLNQYNRQTLVLTPTRELAIQIENELKKFTTHMKIYSTVCVGGTSIVPQIRGLRRRNHFVIGTPGRVQDLIDRRVINPTKFTTAVLDEADRMLDMGFIHDMRSILGALPEERETLFFSATMNDTAKQLANDFLNDPVTIAVKKKDVTDSIAQDVVRYGAHHKFDTLLELLGDDSFKRVIIFGAMKHSVQKLAEQLTKNDIKAEAIHGNKTHGQRQKALATFKSGNARVLVATDVAARGIHVDNVTHVINYDLPSTFEDYVHRIGRTGRSTKKGMALTFVAE